MKYILIVDVLIILHWPVKFDESEPQTLSKVNSKLALCTKYSKRILLDIVQNAHQFLLFNVLWRKPLL